MCPMILDTTNVCYVVIDTTAVLHTVKFYIKQYAIHTLMGFGCTKESQVECGTKMGLVA